MARKDKEQVVAVVDGSMAGGDDLKTSAELVVIRAEKTVVASPADYEMAVGFGREIKTLQAQIMDFFRPLKAGAYASWKTICARENEYLGPVEKAEKILKSSMSAWLQEQERRRQQEEAERRRIQEAEARRLQEEALAAIDAGQEEAADVLIAESEIAQEIADMPAAPAQDPVRGAAVRKDWEVTITDPTAVPVSVSGIVLRPVDIQAIKNLVRLAKGNITIPGVRIAEVFGVALRKGGN